MKLVSEIIEAKPGVRRAFHVFTPALQLRLQDETKPLPVMALRSSKNNFEIMYLYERIECMGPASMDPLFDNPLPGTGGRGVAICFTEFPLRVWYPEGRKPSPIETPDTRTPTEVLEDVKLKYLNAFHSFEF